MLSTLKPKQCAAPGCAREFLPRSSFARACSQRCAMKLVRADNKAEKERDAQRLRELDPQRKQKAKKRAQDAFNEFIRLRDHAQPCISCGATNPPMKPGGQWDAGHFLGRGAYPELAFTEDNCNKQCKSCNSGGGRHKAKERTVNQQYEANLILRIGADRVAALRAPHPALHLTEADYEAMATTYRAKARELKKERA